MSQAKQRFNGSVLPTPVPFFTDFSTINAGQTKFASLAGEKFGIPLLQHQSPAFQGGVCASLAMCLITTPLDNEITLSWMIDGISQPNKLSIPAGALGIFRINVHLPFPESSLINMVVTNNATSGRVDFVTCCGVILT